MSFWLHAYCFGQRLLQKGAYSVELDQCRTKLPFATPRRSSTRRQWCSGNAGTWWNTWLVLSSCCSFYIIFLKIGQIKFKITIRNQVIVNHFWVSEWVEFNAPSPSPIQYRSFRRRRKSFPRTGPVFDVFKAYQKCANFWATCIMWLQCSRTWKSQLYIYDTYDSVTFNN